MSLFGPPSGPQVLLDREGAWMRLSAGWLPRGQADRLLADLNREIQPEPGRIRIFGRDVAIPRLQAWHGDLGTGYAYSGVRLEPRPWTPCLASLRQRLESELAPQRFNSVLVNLYRDGQDCVGWHADDEPELGPEPVIASVSLGATRRLRWKPKPDTPGAGWTGAIDLEHGDLLLMGGRSQATLLHALPRTRAAVAARWNLTFRCVRS